MTTQTTEQSQTTTVTEYGWLKPNGETVWGQVTFGVATIRGYKPETFAGDDVRQADINLLKLMLTEQADRAGVERDYYLQGWSIVARTIITITQPTEHVVVVDEL